MVQLVRVGSLMSPGQSAGPPPTVSYTGGNQTRVGPAIGMYNFGSAQALAYRALLGNGTAHTLLGIGDSTMAGVSSAAGARKADSWMTRLALNMNNGGLIASTDSYFGDANTGSSASYQLYVPDMNTIGAGWAFNAVETLGGKMFQNTTTTTGDLSFGRHSSSDCVDIYFAGTSTMKVRYGGVDQENFAVAGTGVHRTTWINAGTAFVMRRVSGTANISGAILRDTTVSGRIDVANAGRSGSGSVYWSDNASPNRGLNFLPIVAAPVVYEGILIGDWGDASGLTAADTKTNLKVTLDKIVGYGGLLVLIVPQPTPTSIASAQRQKDWTDVVYDLADEYGCPLFDVHAHFGNDYNNLVTAGYTFDTSSHINAAGYADYGDFIWSCVQQLKS